MHVKISLETAAIRCDSQNRVQQQCMLYKMNSTGHE